MQHAQMHTALVDELSVKVLGVGVNALIKKRPSHDARVFSFILFPLNRIRYSLLPELTVFFEKPYYFGGVFGGKYNHRTFSK